MNKILQTSLKRKIQKMKHHTYPWTSKQMFTQENKKIIELINNDMTEKKTTSAFLRKQNWLQVEIKQKRWQNIKYPNRHQHWAKQANFRMRETSL